MRLTPTAILDDAQLRFNLRREAAPHATKAPGKLTFISLAFQSQTRSRSTCDDVEVTIANQNITSLNLRREAAPHATGPGSLSPPQPSQFQSQTRSRSTCDEVEGAIDQHAIVFQSQTRSRSTCDRAMDSS